MPLLQNISKRILLTSFIITLFACFNSCGFKEITFLGLEKIDIVKISKQGIEADISAKIKNPNHLSFLINKSDINVRINDIDVGAATLMNKVKIKRNSEEVYLFKVKSNFSNLNFTDLFKIASIITSKKLTIEAEGNIKVSKGFLKYTVPVQVKNDISL